MGLRDIESLFFLKHILFGSDLNRREYVLCDYNRLYEEADFMKCPKQ